jgi:3-hydroxyacyl-CoA dehydrogenase
MKKDIKQVNDIAKAYNMTEEERKEFGKFLENEKKRGRIGNKNDKGDYTYQELEEKARKFIKGK